MADPDAPAWMLDDDDTTFDAAPADGDEQSAGESTAAVPAEAAKPPSQWRTTYKLAVSVFRTLATCRKARATRANANGARGCPTFKREKIQ